MYDEDDFDDFEEPYYDIDEDDVEEDFEEPEDLEAYAEEIQEEMLFQRLLKRLKEENIENANLLSENYEEYLQSTQSEQS